MIRQLPAWFLMAAVSLFTDAARGQDPTVVDDSRAWVKHVVFEGAACMTAVAGQFGGDERLDIICNAGQITRLLIAPDWSEQVLERGEKYIHSAVMDVDRDGDLDYLAARYNPGLIVWMEQPESTAASDWHVRQVDDQVHGIHGLLTGDVDLDGRLDLLATSAQPKPPFPNSLAWFKAPDDPTSNQPWQRHVFAHQDAPGLTHYLGLGDVDGDGRPDAATGAKGGPQDASGLGEWFAWWAAPTDSTDRWTKHLIAAQQPGATNVHPADVNADGKMDFVASRGHGHGVVWFEAPDWVEHPIHPTIREPHCLVVQDLDDDGDMDAATCAFGDRLAVWFENDGLGRFVTHIVGREQEAYDIRAIDMDRDGDLDFLIAGRNSNNVVWYQNPRLR